MIKFLIIQLILVVTTSSYILSQKINFGIDIGQQSYKMEDLKSLNLKMKGIIPFDSKITENFPDFYNYRCFVYYNLSQRIGLGIVYSYKSTGSRISRKDFSGNYNFDMKINGNAPGIIFNYTILKKYGFSLNSFNDFSVCKIKLNLREVIDIYEVERREDKYNFESTNFYYDPNLKLGYQISLLNFNVGIGYQFDFIKKNLKSKSEENINLENIYGKSINADWSGFHINLSLGITI